MTLILKHVLNVFTCILTCVFLYFGENRYTQADDSKIGVAKEDITIFETRATHAIVVDNQTGRILYNKKSTEKINPASLTKMLTAYVVFSLLKKQKLQLSDTLIVTENAYKKGGARSKGATMFAELNDTISIKNLLKGLIIQSGNDAAITIAEGISGSEEKFSQLMNEYAKKIGMWHSNFTNATGLYDKKHYSTAKDMVILSLRLIKDFPEYSYLFAHKKFKWNNIVQKNRNTLLTMDESVDGIKTGYIKQSGYNIAITAKKKTTRITVVLIGMKNKKQRTDESKKILDWAFEKFRYKTLYKENDILIKLPVWAGKLKFISVTAKKEIGFLLNLNTQGNITKKITYQTPIIAPIKKGTILGKLEINQGKIKATFPLYATHEIKKANLITRVLQGSYLTFKNLQNIQ